MLMKGTIVSYLPAALALLLLPVVMVGCQAAGGNAASAEAMTLVNQGDVDQDDAVDRAELDAWIDRRFAEFDADADGEIDRDEYVASAPAMAGRRVEPAQIFDRRDANGDGRLTRDEFEAGPEMLFARLDADGDGVLTRAEVDAARQRRQGDRRRR